MLFLSSSVTTSVMTVSYVEPEICVSWFLLLVLWRTNQVGISGEEVAWRETNINALWYWTKSFLIFPCLAPVIFLLQLLFKRYLGFFTAEITFQYIKLDVVIGNFSNFFTVTVTAWVTLLFSISFLSAYLTMFYAKFSFSLCEWSDNSWPECRGSFFYNHLVFTF